ncbi:MAG: sugar phosphate isomerase/epimerase [Oscillospiraceae bacterium]|nr:sugar phosphate isomerase/epimerase [Oscillospiraceae bacterium]
MEFAMYAGFSDVLKEKGAIAAADRAAELQVTAVEMFEVAGAGHPSVIPDRESAKKVRAALNERGLHVCCWSAYADLYTDTDAEASLCRQAELACEIGSPFLHHTLLPGLKLGEDSPAFDEAVEKAVDAAARIAKYAEPLGITCIYEDQGMYVNGVENFGFFLREMKNRCRNVGVCGDVGNIFFVDEKPEDFFAAFKDDILHVHLKDYLRKKADRSPGYYWLPTKGGNWLRDTMIGDGIVNIEACVNILKDAGYSGALALENGHPEPFDIGVKQAMEAVGKYLR